MTDAPSEHASVRYEHADIRLGCLLAVIAFGVLTVAITIFAIGKLYWFEAGAQEAEKRSAYPLVTSPTAALPPQPRLEELNRMADVDDDERLKGQLEALRSGGPAEEKGFVHVPIEKAIQAVAGNLPVRKHAAGFPADDSGLVDSGESNSGRMFRTQQGGEP
jgi:hypothetical protein